MVERALAHGREDATQAAYDREEMLEDRRKAMSDWAAFLSGADFERRADQAGHGVIRIAISAEAFEAIARTLPLGSLGYEAEANERASATSGLSRMSSPS